MNYQTGRHVCESGAGSEPPVRWVLVRVFWLRQVGKHCGEISCIWLHLKVTLSFCLVPLPTSREPRLCQVSLQKEQTLDVCVYKMTPKTGSLSLPVEKVQDFWQVVHRFGLICGGTLWRWLSYKFTAQSDSGRIVENQPEFGKVTDMITVAPFWQQWIDWSGFLGNRIVTC